VWLLGTVRQLDAARQALAREAVLRERLSIDGELRRTLGIALAGIAARGERAGSLSEPSAVDEALQDLVASSRRTLADARQLIRSYHRPSVRAELSTAATLLAAAGIRTRVVLPPDEPPGASFREQLRAATAELLRDGAVRSCILTVDADGRLDVSRGADLAVVGDD
jgi:two-component system sensor histidine kinase DesK